MFKIGDRVRIKSKNIVGDITKITKIGNYIETEDTLMWLYGDDNLELVTDTQPTHERPPLGLEPKKIWVDRRYSDVVEAILRYIDKSMPIPLEWVEEYNELASKGEIK